MKTKFSGKRINGVLAVLPENEIFFEDEVSNYLFPESQTMRLKKIMGYKKHVVAKPETSTSDLCVYGPKLSTICWEDNKRRNRCNCYCDCYTGLLYAACK